MFGAREGEAPARATVFLAGAVAVPASPAPARRGGARQAQMSFEGVPAGQITVPSVRGAKSGSHSGRLAAYSQHDGASFVPARAFGEGERVTVRAVLHAHGRHREL